jgi:hypothetical protein
MHRSMAFAKRASEVPPPSNSFRTDAVRPVAVGHHRDESFLPVDVFKGKHAPDGCGAYAGQRFEPWQQLLRKATVFSGSSKRLRCVFAVMH